MHDKIKPNANTEKQSLDLLFLSSPTSTCKVLSRETGGTKKLVPRLHSMHTYLGMDTRTY